MIRDGRIPCDGFVIGSGRSKGKTSKAAAMKHDGIVLGGSITSDRKTPSARALNKLASGRSDGKVC